MKKQILGLLVGFSFIHSVALAADLKVGDKAPLFKAKTQDGKEFDLASRKGKWTVLYFYPKSGTPGCTKQAQGFRDGIDKIRAAGAEVYGISTNTVEEQANFYKEQHLNFTLLADPKDEIVNLYGSKMPMLNMSKRWTFIINPNLTIRSINRNVEAEKDAENVAKELVSLSANPGN
jgi:peroxiredoxin Q/BCP